MGGRKISDGLAGVFDYSALAVNKVYDHAGFVVFDDVLSEEAWSSVWTYFQFEELHPVTTTEGAWKLENGQPLAGPAFHTPPRLDGYEAAPGTYPTETGVDPVLELLMEHAESFSEWVGDAWFRISGRAFVYPSGSSLTWHRDDHAYYSGAFIYYAHPEWNAQWGGELLIAEPDGLDDLPVMPFRFENREYSERLMDVGVGHYVFPKPNRLVVLGDLAHCVTPVTPSAGRAVRAALSGFFLTQELPSDDDE